MRVTFPRLGDCFAVSFGEGVVCSCDVHTNHEGHKCSSESPTTPPPSHSHTTQHTDHSHVYSTQQTWTTRTRSICSIRTTRKDKHSTIHRAQQTPQSTDYRAHHEAHKHTHAILIAIITGGMYHDTQTMITHTYSPIKHSQNAFARMCVCMYVRSQHPARRPLSSVTCWP